MKIALLCRRTNEGGLCLRQFYSGRESNMALRNESVDESRVSGLKVTRLNVHCIYKRYL